MPTNQSPWISLRKVALVTGANRGIGFEICRQLARKKVQVILTSRDAVKGKTACERLKKEGLDVDFCQLDVVDPKSVKKAAAYVEKKYRRLDILINNAGVFLDSKNFAPASIFTAKLEVIRDTMEINVYGVISICQALVPIMKKNNFGRIVNVSSGMGQLSQMNGQYPGYRLSKVSINALTRILSDELKGTNILVNSMCPGWVRTDMGGKDADRTPEQGADTAIWLATLPNDGPRGGFFRDRKPIPW